MTCNEAVFVLPGRASDVNDEHGSSTEMLPTADPTLVKGGDDRSRANGKGEYTGGHNSVVAE